MSTKMITFAAAAVLLGSTAFASAQSLSNPRPYGYYNGYNYYGGPVVTFGLGMAPGYYAPGYYDYAPGYYGNRDFYFGNGNYDRWNDRWDWQ